MLHGKCVRPCRFAYGGCENRGVKVHPRYLKDENLLRDEEGNFFCHDGKFLTIYSDICEHCGEIFKPAPHLSDGNYLAYQCTTCNQVIKKEV